MTTTIGIDPGKKGAIAILGPGARVVDMPLTPAAFTAELHGWGIGPATAALCVAYIEQQQAWPKQGATSTFKIGVNVGWLEGVCSAFGIRVVFVNPPKWKHHFGLNRDKDASRILAQRTWPALAGRLARKKDEGRAEALLIAEYGRVKEANDG